MKIVFNHKYLVIGAVLLSVLIIGYRYSGKRLQLMGHYDKVWAHRMNDLKKLKSAEGKFVGVEIDLKYDPTQNILGVTHGNIVPQTIHFEDYLAHISNKELQLWLDIKELTSANAPMIFNRLEELFDKYNLLANRSRIIIESPHIASLRVFKEAGYRVSWYITEEITTENWAEIKRDIIKENNLLNTELSSNYHNYLFLKEGFPDRAKNFWMLTSTYDWEIIQKYRMTREMLKDTTVKTVLIPYINFNRYF